MGVTVKHHWVKDRGLSDEWLLADWVKDGDEDALWYIAGCGAAGQLAVDVVGPEIQKPSSSGPLMSRYKRIIPRSASGESDVYDVLIAFEVKNPDIQNAVIQLLEPSNKPGSASWARDIGKAACSLRRAVELEANPKEGN